MTALAGAQLGDPHLHCLAAATFENGFGCRQGLRFVGRARRLETTLGKFIRHPNAMEAGFGQEFFGFREKQVAHGDERKDFLGDGTVIRQGGGRA